MIRAALLAVLLAGPAFAAPPSCPRTLRTAQQAVDVPAGLVADEEASDWSNLTYVEFYIGPKIPYGPGFAPVRYAVPPSAHAVAPRSVSASWDFSQAQEEMLLGCHYHGTRIYLLVPVPDSVTGCTVHWGRNDTGAAIPGAVLGIECQ